MIVYKRNEHKGFKPYEMPPDWHTPSIFEIGGFDEMINCASCGKKVEFGNCYISKTIFNAKGTPLVVCAKCHEKEWKPDNYDNR